MNIGKNIVGVVLACNNIEVVDLGVMVPVTRSWTQPSQLKPTSSALRSHATPSLDEMVVVAKEMTRRTSPFVAHRRRDNVKQHTAVRIAPAYDGSTVHVLDASR